MKKVTRISEGVTGQDRKKCSIPREESDIVGKNPLRVTARIQKMQEIPGSTNGQILIAV